MPRKGDLVHKLSPPVSCGAQRKESDACNRRGGVSIHAMAAPDANVFVGSLGTSVLPPLGKRLRESMLSQRDQSHMCPHPRPSRKQRCPTPGKTSASRACPREGACPR